MYFLDPYESLETEITVYRTVYLKIKVQYLSFLATSTILDF